MTPSEKHILKSLVAFAWADGRIESSESSVIEGMLTLFDATEAEEQEILDYSRVPRTLEDIAVTALGPDDRELLLTNAALLVAADGQVSAAEAEMLARLARLLEMADAAALEIIGSVVHLPVR